MDPTVFQRHKLLNWLQSTLMLSGMGGLVAVVGWLLAGEDGAWLALGLGVLMVVFSPRLSPRLVLRMYGAVPIEYSQAPQLYALVEELAQRAELPAVPRLYYIPSPELNAFTMGRPQEAVIAITDGLLRTMNLRELAGVLGHEIAHIRNNDVWVMNLADTLTRVTANLSLLGQLILLINLPLIMVTGEGVSWLAVLLLVFAPSLSALLQLALSRTREYDADLGAVELTGDPEALASALAKLERHNEGWLRRILLPGRGDPEPSLLRTHPPTRERIRRLMELARQQPRPTPPLTQARPATVELHGHFPQPRPRRQRWPF